MKSQLNHKSSFVEFVLFSEFLYRRLRAFFKWRLLIGPDLKSGRDQFLIPTGYFFTFQLDTNISFLSVWYRYFFEIGNRLEYNLFSRRSGASHVTEWNAFEAFIKLTTDFWWLSLKRWTTVSRVQQSLIHVLDLVYRCTNLYYSCLYDPLVFMKLNLPQIPPPPHYWLFNRSSGGG